MVGQYIRKLNEKGKAFCTLCNKDLLYASRGWKAFEQHICCKLHQDMQKLKKNNYSLSGAYGTSASNNSNASPYGIHPIFKKAAVKPPDNYLTITPLADRILNAEATILGVTADLSLPFSCVLKLIELSKELARDKKALDHLSMNRTTASYKMKYGVGKTFEEELVNIMKSTHFLNLDECTSNNYKKVLTILVSYFSPLQKEVVVRHFKSLSFIKVNSESIFNGINQLFEESNIPWTNLVSVLMDSCNVMRGSKSGWEVRIRREKAPHLLDIDGDSCHHAHNACKAFCKPFQGFAEQLMVDIYNDYKWSTDQRDALEEICSILNVKYTMPQKYVSHRWLSVYDVSLDTLRLLDAHTLLYVTWLVQFESTLKDRAKYAGVSVEIYHRLEVKEPARSRITEIRKDLLKKNLTSDGKARKLRIAKKLFDERKYLKLILGLYSSVLPLLKGYVMMFEMTEPLIHNLHEEQVRLFREFIACFMKPEVVKNATSSSLLKKLDLKTDKNLLSPENMFMGNKAKNIIMQSSRKDVEIQDFLSRVKDSYIDCGKCLQDKMPLDNALLKTVAAIHLDCRGHSTSQKYLLRLPKLVTNVLKGEEMEDYELQVRKFETDDQIEDIEEDTRIDHWWANEKLLSKYPLLVKMVKAILSCFHGPQVKASFSIMNNTIDHKSNRMNIDTYNAIQNVRYSLRPARKSPVAYFHKKDFLHDKVDSQLVRNMQKSPELYCEEVKNIKLQKEEKLAQLQVKSKKILSKRKAKEILEDATKKARMCHPKSVSKSVSKK